MEIGEKENHKITPWKGKKMRAVVSKINQENSKNNNILYKKFCKSKFLK